jgi:hypothetical protein
MIILRLLTDKGIIRNPVCKIFVQLEDDWARPAPRDYRVHTATWSQPHTAKTTGRATAPGTDPPLVSSIPEEDRLKIWLNSLHLA